ncbi:equilibrative nucleoside transporter 3, partial [Nephila pilipes]
VINPMEQETLLDPGPVKLAPCWESRHAPTDELNFKTTTPKGEFDGKPPADRQVLFNLSMFFFCLLNYSDHGNGMTKLEDILQD